MGFRWFRWFAEALRRSAPTQKPIAGSFCRYMANEVPGCYFWLGGGGGPMVHHPQYDFNDETLPLGAAMFVELVQRRLPQQAAS